MDDERLNERGPAETSRSLPGAGGDAGALENPAALAIAERIGRDIRRSIPPADELTAARERVWARVRTAMTSPPSAMALATARRSRPRRRLSRFGALVAAAVLLATVATTL